MSKNLINISDSFSKELSIDVTSVGIIDLPCVEFNIQITNILSTCFQDLILELKQHSLLTESQNDCYNIQVVTKYIETFKNLIDQSGPSFKEQFQQELATLILNNINNRFIFNALINISDSLSDFNSYKK
ncbi:MAG: hypothetical protein V3575_04820 [Candidatus Absconditabacteria bacterium]